jgi:tetrahydromethanopterin S-methyltransferase subunit G
MMDKENIGAILQEMSDERKIPTDSQKKVADFFVNLVMKLEKGDKEAIKMLNMTPQELQQMASQNTMQTEAFENLRSKASGLFGGDPVKKRYDLLIQSLNKHIWEFTQDVKNTKIEDVAEYNKMFAELQKIEPSLQAKGGFFQKIGYGVGRGVGTVAKIGSVGVLGAALGGLGLPAYAIGGILGGGLSVLKNSQNTKMDTKAKLKKALIGAGLGAMVGYAFSKLQSVMGGNESGVAGDSNDSVDTSSTPSDATSDQGTGVEGVPETGVSQNASGGIDSTSKVRVGSFPNAERVAFTKGKLQALRQLAAHLGTDTIRGVTYDQFIGADGNMYVTAEWSQAMSDQAAEISRQMGN